MKRFQTAALVTVLLSLASGCYRQEVQVAEYSVPEMKTAAVGTYLQNRLKGLPGIVESSFDTNACILTVSYQSSTIRTMNIEETIALAGFAVNDRPANASAKIPEGVK